MFIDYKKITMKKFFIAFAMLLGVISLQAQVGIGTITPNSTLTVEGSFATKIFPSPFPITLNESNHTVFANDVTLPDPTNIIGREYIIKTDGNAATVSAQPGDLIDLVNSIPLNPWESIVVKAVTSNQWLIVGGKFNKGAEEIDDLSDGKTFNNSVYLGFDSGLGAIGNRNVGLGQFSLINADGDENVAIGHLAGSTITANGNNNVVIGAFASESVGTGITTGDNNILLGDRVNTSGPTVNNELNIGNAIYGTNIYGSTAKIGVGNGNNAPNSTLSVNGSMSLPIRTVTGPTTLNDTDYTVLVSNSTTNGANITLPSAVGRTGRLFVIKNISTAVNNSQNVLTTSGQTIDGILTAFGLSNQSNNIRGITVQSNGTNWYVVAIVRP